MFQNMASRANSQRSAVGRPWRDDRWNAIAHALPWLLLGATLLGIWQTPARIHQDCAMCLQQAQLLLSGAVPCYDIVDTNPPLIAYLNVPPVLVARALNAPPILVFHFFVVLALLVSSVELFWLMRQPAMRLRPIERDLLLTAWVLAYFYMDWLGATGQREQLFVFFYVPYLFLRILRHQGGAASAFGAALLGFQAALGASLKPHFLLAAAAIEGLLLFDTLGRRKPASSGVFATGWRLLARPENVALALTVLVYVVHWFFVPAVMREAYFGRWVPMVFRGYRAYDATLGEIIDHTFYFPMSGAALAGVLGTAALAARPQTHGRRLFLGLSAFGVLGIALIFVQHKGWQSHRIPFQTAGLLCLGLLAARAFLWPGRLRRLLVPSAVVVLSVFVAAWLLKRESFGNVEPPNYALLRAIVETRSSPGDRVLIVATSVSPASPMLLKTGRWPGSRYLHFFPIAMLYAEGRWQPGRAAYRTYDEAPPEERRFLDDLQEDVERFHPRLIIICNALHWYGLADEFNTYDYMVHSGWTRKALPPYREVPGLDEWKVFERK